MKTQNYLAMDFGASTGRGILGKFDGEKLVLEETHRFPNFFVDVNGLFYWDILRMYHHTLTSLKKARLAVDQDLAGLGIDTWGTDYGLLDKNGQLTGNPRCMRGADATVSNKVNKLLTFRELFGKTGIQTIYGNTVFQLYERKLQKDIALQNAETLLMLPDLLAYFLTGQKHTEYTMATTTMLYNPVQGGWDTDILRTLGLPRHIFTDIIMPASGSFPVRRPLLEDTGFEALRYTPVGSHDTASAVAAAPLRPGEAFCSSGTWSLLGVESELPVLTEEAFAFNFSNEGTVDGKVRLLKNIMGMWVLQQCREEWHKRGRTLGWDEIVQAAQAAPAHRSFIDLEDPVFYSAGGMAQKMQGYCRDTGQPVPETVGEIARCAYESVALRYRLTVEQLRAVTGNKVTGLRIVGGGGQNRLLNQFAANAMGIPVYAGPVECACVGNILVQAKARGELATAKEIRQVAERSFPIEEYEPKDTGVWNLAYEKYCGIVGAPSPL